MDCPQCGETTEQLFEGYCEPCSIENQRALDSHNASFDRWERLTDGERKAELEMSLRHIF